MLPATVVLNRGARGWALDRVDVIKEEKMLLTLIVRETIDARTRAIAGVFTQMMLVAIAGLALCAVLMAYHASTSWLDGVGLAVASVALLLSLLAAGLPMARVAIGRLRSNSAEAVFQHEALFWRGAWVLLVLGALGLSLPIWSELLQHFEIGKAMVMLGICFMVLGAFFANQMEQMRGQQGEA